MGIKVSSPGVIKLLGEHAVVYGRTALAAAINIYAHAETESIQERVLRVKFRQLDLEQEFTEAELARLYASFSKRKGINEFVETQTIGTYMLPFATIASRLLGEHKLDVLGREVVVSSEIQPKTGLASSAAGYAAFVGSLLKACGKSLSDEQAMDVARDGDRILHLNENAGSIDVGTCYYGGYVSRSAKNGVRKISSGLSADVVIIDTGPKKSTAETVAHVRKQYDSDRSGTEKILDEMEKCTQDGLAALKKNDIAGFGELMYLNHALLKRLGVSTEGLDRAVEVSRSNGAYGAKLSGGGGGGVAIAFSKDPDALARILNEQGFKAYKANISEKGVKEQLK